MHINRETLDVSGVHNYQNEVLTNVNKQAGQRNDQLKTDNNVEDVHGNETAVVPAPVHGTKVQQSHEEQLSSIA